MNEVSITIAAFATRLLVSQLLAVAGGWTLGKAIVDWQREGHFSEDKVHWIVFCVLSSLVIGVLK